jgi:hypothetical protein
MNPTDPHSLSGFVVLKQIEISQNNKPDKLQQPVGFNAVKKISNYLINCHII